MFVLHTSPQRYTCSVYTEGLSLHWDRAKPYMKWYCSMVSVHRMASAHHSYTEWFTNDLSPTPVDKAGSVDIETHQLTCKFSGCNVISTSRPSWLKSLFKTKVSELLILGKVVRQNNQGRSYTLSKEGGGAFSRAPSDKVILHSYWIDILSCLKALLSCPVYTNKLSLIEPSKLIALWSHREAYFKEQKKGMNIECHCGVEKFEHRGQQAALYMHLAMDGSALLHIDSQRQTAACQPRGALSRCVFYTLETQTQNRHSGLKYKADNTTNSSHQL